MKSRLSSKPFLMSFVVKVPSTLLDPLSPPL